MINRPVALMLVISSLSWGAWAQAADFTEGWTSDVQVPEVKDENGKVAFQSATVKLWIEQGWLVARREQPNGYWDWQIVLAPALDPKPPQVQVGNLGSIDINYGRYFIREVAGRLRVLRERKTANSPPWPAVPKMIGAQVSVSNNGRDFQSSIVSLGDWWFYATGMSESNDVWLRMNHRELTKGYGIRQIGPLRVGTLGDCSVQDEGDLLTAERQAADDERVKDVISKKKSAGDSTGGTPSPNHEPPGQ